MALHLLVFSSDAKAALILGQILSELEIEVEFCSEIFSSVQKVTGRPFDAIIVDWDEGAEATFLVKTARELKSTRECLALAVVTNDAAKACALQVGAHGTLRKPIDPEEARETLRTLGDLIASSHAGSPPKPSNSALEDQGGQNHFEQSSPPAARILSRASAVPIDFGNEAPEALRNSGTNVLPSLPPPPIFQQHVPYRHQAGQSSCFIPAKAELAKFNRRQTSRVAVLTSILFIAATLYVWAPDSSVMEHFSLVAPATVERTDVTPAEISVIRPERPDSGSRRELPRYTKRENQNQRSPSAELPDMESAPGSEVSSHLGPTSTAMLAPSGSPSSAPGAAAREEQPSGVRGRSPVQIPESLKRASVASSLQVRNDPPPPPPGVLHRLVLSEEASRQLLISATPPTYPEQALKAGLQGAVVLQAWIARDGQILDLKLVSGYFVLGRAAFDAVKRWRYKPYVLNGQAVETQTLVTVNFKLPTLGINLKKPVAETSSAVLNDASRP